MFKIGFTCSPFQDNWYALLVESYEKVAPFKLLSEKSELRLVSPVFLYNKYLILITKDIKFPDFAFIFKGFVSFTKLCTLLSEIYELNIYSFYSPENYNLTGAGTYSMNIVDNIITCSAEKGSSYTLKSTFTDSTGYVLQFDCKVVCYAGGSVSNQVNRFGILFGDLQFNRDISSVSHFNSNPYPYNTWFSVELHREENTVYAVINGNRSSLLTISDDFTNTFGVRKWSDGSLYRAGEVYLKNFELNYNF